MSINRSLMTPALFEFFFYSCIAINLSGRLLFLKLHLVFLQQVFKVFLFHTLDKLFFERPLVIFTIFRLRWINDQIFFLFQKIKVQSTAQ